MSAFEPTTIVPDDVEGEVFVHVIGATVWTDERPADGAWRTHVVGVLGGYAAEREGLRRAANRTATLLTGRVRR